MSRVWRLRLYRLLVAVSLIFIPVGAQLVVAQTPPAQVNPGQVQHRIPTPVETPRPPAPLAIPSTAPTAPQGVVNFVLTGVEIEGATRFDAASFAPLYERFLARKIGISEIEEILRRITAKYRESGYFLSHAIAEPQSLQNGILRITVIEGWIQRVSFPDTSESESDPLHYYLLAVVTQRPLQLDTLERAILLINDLPGISGVTPQLRPIDEKAGSYELVLSLARSRLSGVVSLDSRGTRSLGPAEAQAVGAVNSVITSFDRLSVNFFTTPNQPRELLSEQVSYDLPLGYDGTRVTLTAARTDVHPQGNLASLALSGNATLFSADVTHPVLRMRGQSVWVGGGFDVLQSLQNQQGILQFDDRLRVLRLHGLYLGNDAWGGTNSAFLEASQGFNGLGASRAGGADLSRPNGRPDFTKVTGTVVRQQHLYQDWYLHVAASGQVTAEPLLVSEQFALGGTQFGRAYDPGEIVGDDGVAGSAELRYDGTIQNSFIRSYEIYGFYDLGVVWNMNGSAAAARQSLASTGVGVRLALQHNLNFSLEIADPLTRIVAAEGGKPLRVFASISTGF